MATVPLSSLSSPLPAPFVTLLAHKPQNSKLIIITTSSTLELILLSCATLLSVYLAVTLDLSQYRLHQSHSAAATPSTSNHHPTTTDSSGTQLLSLLRSAPALSPFKPVCFLLLLFFSSSPSPCSYSSRPCLLGAWGGPGALVNPFFPFFPPLPSRRLSRPSTSNPPTRSPEPQPALAQLSLPGPGPGRRPSLTPIFFWIPLRFTSALPHAQFCCISPAAAASHPLTPNFFLARSSFFNFSQLVETSVVRFLCCKSPTRTPLSPSPNS